MQDIDMEKFYLIGLGIKGEKSLTLEAIEILKKTKKIFLESYTNYLEKGIKKKIEKVIKKKIFILKREEVENEKIILEELKKNQVALLVSGDPLIATTHLSLVLSAKKIGSEVEIIFNSSILNAAIGLSGLQAYKFGKICTIPYWREKYSPTSFLDVIEANQSIGAHTICLLDLDTKLGPMSIKKAFEIIFKAQEVAAKKIIDENTKIIVLSALGTKRQKIFAGKIKELKKDLKGPNTIIIPSKMHFLEEEYFQKIQKIQK
ncbi:MAG: diphthine synthase [Candidatus Anstonellaceae archaeon]